MGLAGLKNKKMKTPNNIYEAIDKHTNSIKNVSATLTVRNGSKITGEYTGFSSILNAHCFSAYNGNTYLFQSLNQLQIN